MGKLKASGARGLDGLGPAEIKQLPDAILEYLRVFFDLIEMKRVWPRALTVAAVTLIPKGEGGAPLAQRPISVMPVVYRLWAATRARHSLPWQETWICEDQHGCRPQHGTSGVLLRVAAELEAAMLNGEAVAGLSLDFAKAFDNVPVAIALAILQEHGLSNEILHPLIDMHGRLRRRFKIRGYLGQPFGATNGIMQGCPLSVLLLNASVSVLTKSGQSEHDTVICPSYVDDTSFLCKYDQGLHEMMHILQTFLNLTGMRLRPASRCRVLEVARGRFPFRRKHCDFGV